MTATLRILLILCSLATFIYTVRRIRASRVDIADTIFWIVFAAVLLIMSVFPGIVGWLARTAGVQSEENVVFLLTIAALLYKCFSLTLKASALEIKVKTLTAAVAARSANGDPATAPRAGDGGGPGAADGGHADMVGITKGGNG